MNYLQTRTEKVVQQLFLLALLSVPVSTAAMNIFATLTLLGFIWYVASTRNWPGIKHLPGVFVLCLYCLLLIGLLWSNAPDQDELTRPLVKYSKLFFIPIGIALTWRDRDFARRALLWFMVGASIATLSSYLAFFSLIPSGVQNLMIVGTPDNPIAFKNHITFGILSAFSAVVCFCYCFHTSSFRLRLIAFAMGLYFSVPVIFLTQGRTGYVVYFGGLFALAIMRFRHRWKMQVFSVLIVVIIFAGLYAGSQTMHGRVNQLVSEIQKSAHSAADQSSGSVRLNYMIGGLNLIAEKPLFGHGTGSVQESFAPIAKVLWPSTNPMHSQRHQLHSELLLIGIQLGAVGLVLYFALLGSLAWVTRRTSSFEGDCLVILCLMFGIGSAFNSLLWDVTEGRWFTLLAGCLYACARRTDQERFT